ncbi:GNAT family N-acetyltransferase [Natrarchaeobaculum aegyptiacum]|uniref:GNAT family N-acetyltransferase n=1 Tax=Natrarchaeobaculum aegyptiacum TaxID=745377 RepID=A0A2Z2HYN4_9EURY|nr:GNAT family N-acetyltransferase [Natrarchaeobaculum aegyptiacum]ARS90224.1 GNAT family N-acetyltransferase [Natrarchaeobaculum aegyptiacum]
MDVDRIDLETWADALPNRGGEVFHDPDALAVLDAHTDAEMRLYGAFKGQQAVGLLPVFVDEKPVGRTVTSPPPGLGVPRLGPVIFPNSPKRRKWERINAELAEGVLADLAVDQRTTLFRMTAPVGYEDPRPYAWNDLAVDPRFTYVVDLEGCGDLEDAMAGFSKSLRNEMRRYEDSDVEIGTEGIDAALRIYEDVVDQYAAYDDEAPMTRTFLRDLLAAFDEDRWRTYVARDPDGEYLSGILTLFGDELAYYWQGGVTASYDHVSVNNLLHAVVLEDLVTDPDLESITGYDLVGANTERLCEYKGKFNGELRPYYVVESAGLEMAVAKSAYQRVAGSMK